MSDTDMNSASNHPAADDDDDIARINMRIPKEKYEWLQDELDSFTSDTARVQFLIQFYSEQKGTKTDREV